ncbi:microtubule-associated proteins 1A/1B light chain 3A-like [Cloeon dipterum]|uniref:microtubule-associated proteins 1A/1B light chain 3A-like n=1 Tax=Cloeon dipterum TaxID=197152 RepID=UPI0032209270
MSPQNTRADEGVDQPGQTHQDKDSSPCHQAINGRKLPRSYSGYSESFYLRRDVATGIRAKDPSKIPILLKKSEREKSLTSLAEARYAVPYVSTVSQFMMIIRKKLKLNPHESLYLMVNNRSMVNLSSLLIDVYIELKAEDGFLHITYASQETFG